MSRLNSHSHKGFLYLFEPILIAIIVILMLAFIPRLPTQNQTRLIELHSQDVLATIQKDGSIDAWLSGDKTKIENNIALIHELNPNYAYYFSISSDKTLYESGTPLKGITSRRTYLSEKPLTLKLTLSLNSPRAARQNS